MKHPRTTWFAVASAAGIVLSGRRDLSPWVGLAGEVLTAVALVGLGLNTPDKNKTEKMEDSINKLRTETEQFTKHHR